MSPGGAAAPAAARGFEPGFFERSVHEVAPELVGATLLFGDSGGVIVETEAYDQDDPACHAHVGLTPRTSVLFGPPGHAYVYLSYGIHRLFNLVCEPEGRGAAVLVRALQPAYGIPAMRRRRGKQRRSRPLLRAGEADAGARHRARAQRDGAGCGAVSDPAALG